MVDDTAVAPSEVETTWHDGAYGRMRSRTVGSPRPGVPEVVVIQGMGVSDYLLPGTAALGTWTRAHLLELPGLSGSGDPPHELTVPEYAEGVVDWLATRVPGPVVVAGHSSGSQVAARVAAERSEVVGLVLAGPVFDPAARSWTRAVLRWLWDGVREPAGLVRLHAPEWRRAGGRRVANLVRVHLAESLDATLTEVTVPVLVLRGRRDPIATREWAEGLADHAPAGGEYLEVPGPHSFPYVYPTAWSSPIRRLAHRATVGVGAPGTG